VGGLRLYQWLAIVFVLAGSAMTAIGGPPAPALAGLREVPWGWLAVLGAVTYAAYGVDFPHSNRRFSRLV
jgi:drug/metabolite transporter (DMT)-like permease